MAKVKTNWTSLASNTIPAEVTTHRENAWDVPITAAVLHRLLDDDANTPTDMERLRAAEAPYCGNWFHTQHITAVVLRLSNEAIRIAMATACDAQHASRTLVFVAR